MPLVVGAFPVVGIKLLADEHAEWALVGIAVIIGSLSLVPSYLRVHRRALPLLAFTCGVTTLLFARLWVGDHHLEITGMVAGGLLITAAHALNRTHCRRCRSCHTESAAACE